MGYDFHITRAAVWFEAEEKPISMEEWLAYVKSDSEMRLDGFAEAGVGLDEVLRCEDPSMAVWTAYSKDGVGGNHAWMWLADGNVGAKNADEEIISKLWRIAQHFGARVVGDDGEEYGADGKEIGKVRSEWSKGFWRRILGR
ncbi:MAG: hypothetical protein KF805_16385 [Phycisphaeraceae bacterium]|nr:hypothetical protein [Phycisphaeraceae bacterium]